tara:strand:- start:814 stop:1302 length:489 start_codon:yes stop_codon:yes gene_type:complete
MKRNKGFTLIELLVVVAIIGSLAAVGVVAYNGYTAAAKKNSSKSIHANAVKYIASELAKCNLSQDEKLFGGTTVTCASNAAAVVAHLVGTSSPMQDKNPYDASKAAISEGTTSETTDDDGNTVTTTSCEEGYTCLSTEGEIITIATTYEDGKAALSNDVEVE